MVSPGDYGRSRQRRPPYFLNSRLIKAADEFKDKTAAINRLWQTDDPHQNDSGHRDPKQPSKRFHPGLCPSQRGPEFAGEGADIQQQSQAERLPRCPGDALETRFLQRGPCETAPVAAGRGTRSALAH